MTHGVIPPKWTRRYSVRESVSLLTDLPSTFLEQFFHEKKKENLILTQKGASLPFFFHIFRHLLWRLLFWCVCFEMFLLNFPATDFLRSCSAHSWCNSGSIWSCSQSSWVLTFACDFSDWKDACSVWGLICPVSASCVWFSSHSFLDISSFSSSYLFQDTFTSWLQKMRLFTSAFKGEAGWCPRPPLSFPRLPSCRPLQDLLEGGDQANVWPSVWFRRGNLVGFLYGSGPVAFAFECSSKSLCPSSPCILCFHPSVSWKSSSRLCRRWVSSFRLPVIFFWRCWAFFWDVFGMCFASVAWDWWESVVSPRDCMSFWRRAIFGPWNESQGGSLSCPFSRKSSTSSNDDLFRFSLGVTKHRICDGSTEPVIGALSL